MATQTTLKSFFGFAKHPFPPSCPPEPLFRYDAIESSIEQAKNALQSRLHVLVTAPAGLGKSSFLRLLVGELNPRDLRPVRVSGEGTGIMEVVSKLADEWGIETTTWSRTTAMKQFVSGLKHLSSSGPFPVALIDEAQNLPAGAINLIRVAAEEAAAPLFSMVLVGDDSFRRTLGNPNLAPLSGRLAARIRLEPLSEGESEAFIAHAFRTAGMQNILAPSAVPTVHAAAGGSPREIGRTLSRAMMLALEKKSRLLSDEIVQGVIDDARS